MDIELAVDAMEIARAYRPHGAVLRRRRLPLAGRGGAAPRRARHRGLHHLDPAADGRRRVAPPGRHLPRHCRVAAQDRPRPGRACRRASRAASARERSIRRSSCSAPLRRSGPAPALPTMTTSTIEPLPMTGASRQARPELPALPASRRSAPLARRASRPGSMRRSPLSARSTRGFSSSAWRPGCTARTAPAGPSPATMRATCSTTRCRVRLRPRQLRGAPRRRARADRRPHHQCGALRAAGEQADAGARSRPAAFSSGPRSPKCPSCARSWRSAGLRMTACWRRSAHSASAAPSATARRTRSASCAVLQLSLLAHNTNTGVLTPEMFREVFSAVRALSRRLKPGDRPPRHSCPAGIPDRTPWRSRRRRSPSAMRLSSVMPATEKVGSSSARASARSASDSTGNGRCRRSTASR